MPPWAMKSIATFHPMFATAIAFTRFTGATSAKLHVMKGTQKSVLHGGSTYSGGKSGKASIRTEKKKRCARAERTP
jgi:hypothetical protein